MTYETSSSVYDNLKDVIFSLGMEISDSILASLRDAVEACRQENNERLTIVEPVLLGIEAVVNHIDAVRAVSDPDAFRLLNILLTAYHNVTEHGLDEAQAQQSSFAALKQVLDWQHLCMLQPKRKAVQEPVQQWETVQEPVASPAETTNFDLQVILNTVQREIAETSKMAARESAIICDLTQAKEKVKAEEETTLSGTSIDGNSDSILSGQFDALHETFQDEMAKLRWELGVARK